MVDNAPPSLNPANNGTLAGTLRTVLSKMLQDMDDMLPAQIVAYDRATNRASVQPLIMVVSTSGQQIQRAQIASVPVMQIGGGNFMLNFNFKPGDLGWIKSNDRDISLFGQGYEQSAPNTARMHSFEDSIFIPDVMRGYTINAEDQENAVLSTVDGTQRVSIWPGKVKITSDTLIVLDSPLTEVTGELITGTESGQSATFNGSINALGDVVARGGVNTPVSLHNHIHINSGGPGDGGVPKV